MKLRVRVGVDEQEITITNPRATLVNVKAAIAIHFKLDPASFRMAHHHVNMDDMSTPLSSSGIVDGDTVTVVQKRSRPDAVVVMPITEGAELPRIEVGPAPHVDPVVRTPVAVETLFAPREMGVNADEDDDIVDGDGFGEDLTPEQRELAEGLLALPNAEALRDQILLNPHEALASIEGSHPRLLELIRRHPHFFYRLVSNPIIDAMDGLEWGDEEEWDAVEGGEEALWEDLGEGASMDIGGDLGNMINVIDRRIAGPRVADADVDESKVEQLIALGFPRERCLAALARAHGNVDRAANFLCDEPQL